MAQDDWQRIEPNALGGRITKAGYVIERRSTHSGMWHLVAPDDEVLGWNALQHIMRAFGDRVINDRKD